MRAERGFAAERTAVAEARRFIEGLLASTGPADVADVVVLLTSELVTNAVLHARSGPVVMVEVEGGRIRVEVRDDSPVLPVRKRYGLQATTGRGLMMLETMATDWGARPFEGGKRVWFIIDVDASDGDGTFSGRAAGAAEASGDDIDLDALAASFGEIDPGDQPRARLVPA